MIDLSVYAEVETLPREQSERIGVMLGFGRLGDVELALRIHEGLSLGVARKVADALGAEILPEAELERAVKEGGLLSSYESSRVYQVCCVLDAAALHCRGDAQMMSRYLRVPNHDLDNRSLLELALVSSAGARAAVTRIESSVSI
ncbi:hypothetical protein [Allohahella marinimesophila]|uniref:Uncharacterized protein n=1 Tax=Allohahella marinimesophila TaxID=1054972 RepID=A0ABP7QCX1_9GAMM